MFVLTELEDCVEIRAVASEKPTLVMEALRSKYVGKLAGDLGLAVDIKRIIDITGYHLREHLLVAAVRFEVLFYRYFTGEICVGAVTGQTAAGILVRSDLGHEFDVSPDELYDSCTYETQGDAGQWVWHYAENRLPFQTGQRVRFRIRRMDMKTGKASAFMNEQGLGPVEWWD